MKRVKSALLDREICVGSWIQTASPVAAEILADSGFSWLSVDCEHSETGLAELAAVLRAAGNTEILVRVRENDTLAIRQALDLGAAGVIVPLVNNAGEAQKAVAAAKYPPKGVRGFGFCRMNGWGRSFDDYAARANDETAVIVMIESRQAVEAIEEIIDVPGVDGVLIGPYDISASYNLTGQINHPVIKTACRRVSEACAAHGVSAGWHIVYPTRELIDEALGMGYTFIALGTDIVFLRQGADMAFDLMKQHYPEKK